MDTFIHSIATVVPETFYAQDDAGQRMKAQFEDRKLERVIHRIYSQSGIDTRYSVVKDFIKDGPGGAFYCSETNTLRSPSTKVRNDIYTQEARTLFISAAQKVLNQSGFDKEDITHVITVSCTGFFAPGPDYFVVKDLGLEPATHRFHVGFMGCFATFPALKMAQAFCEADPSAVVLVISVELCSLHLQPSDSLDSILAASVFADGGAAAIVSARPPAGPALKVCGYETAVTPTGEEDMAWSIGDNGFDIVLSTYVPEILKANIAQTILPLLNKAGFTQQEIVHWAVHPGGRAILDKVRDGLGLEESQLASSREILRQFGNMSSTTILFVLQEVLAQSRAQEAIYAMAFGPGLTVESGMFTRVN